MLASLVRLTVPGLLISGVVCPMAGRAQPFTEVAHTLPGLAHGNIAWGDYDNDGDLDLLMTGATSTNWTPMTRLYRNDGAAFTEVTTGLPDARYSKVAWGDYDHDGDLDVLFAGMDTSIYAQENGRFTEAFRLYALGAQNVAWGDYDHDGDLDVLAYGFQYAGFAPRIHRNNRSRGFENIGASLPELKNPQMAWRDYDNDGDLDILVSGVPPGEASRTTTYCHYYGGIGFNIISLFLPPTDSLDLGDFDNDGDLDILMSSLDSARVGTNPARADASAGLPLSGVSTAIWGDFDNDGYLDVLADVLAGNVRSTKGFQNLAGSGFTNAFSLPTLAPPAPGSVADYDHDGDLDFACLGFPGSLTEAPTLKLFRNDIATSNSPPSAPTGLQVDVGEWYVTFRWNAASDPNQDGGLTYNLRVGTTPGGIDVVVPMSDGATGFRRVPADGNCGTQLTRSIPIYTPGNYYWSVQAVDHGFAGSLFAPEATFVRPAPVLSGFPSEVIVSGESSSDPIPFTLVAYGTPVDSVALSATAAWSPLIPQEGFVFGGSGTNRTLTITPARYVRGETRVTVTATDTNGTTATMSFQVRVEDRFTKLDIPFPPSSSFFGYFGLWGDFNNDGRLDVLVLGQSTTNVTQIWRNDGEDRFTGVTVAIPIVPGTPRAAAGDYDNDGDLDLLVTGWEGVGTGSATLYRNEGDFHFVKVWNSGLPVLAFGAVSWADLDNDGRLDALLMGRRTDDQYVTEAYHNDGQPGFTRFPAGLPVLRGGTLAPADMDNDGRLDLLLAGPLRQSQPGITVVADVFRGLGRGKFAALSATDATWGRGAGAWGDLDADGLLDFFLTINGLPRFYRNTGSGFQILYSPEVVGVGDAAAAWGDYNNDGLPDLALAGGFHTALFFNKGNSLFGDSLTLSDGVDDGSVAWGDYDNDGDLDLLVTGKGSSRVAAIYRNETPNRNTLPAAPDQLTSVQLSDTTVELRWRPSSDSQTTNPAALHYNLRIGTTPGGVDILSPHADPVSGRRHLAGLGNGSHTNRFLISHLRKGTYYWSVQAIDSVWAGSPFSAEATFTVTNTHPEIVVVDRFPMSHGGPQSLSVRVSDEETPAADLVVSAHSANTNLLSHSQIQIAGDGAERRLEINPILHQLGAVTVTITATDAAGAPWSEDVLIELTNAPPVITRITNQVTSVNTPITIPLIVADLETPANELVPQGFSSYIGLVPNEGIVFTYTNNQWRMVITPALDQYSFITEITVVVSDLDGASATNTFDLNVLNFPPVVSAIPDQYITPGEVISALPFKVFDADTHPAEVTVLASSSNPGLVHTNSLVVSGEGTNRWLAITPVPGQAGFAMITVTAIDRLRAQTSIRFLLNIENAVVSPHEWPAVDYGGAAWADYDNDDDYDLVLTGQGTNLVAITFLYRNNGDGTFSNAKAGFPGLTAGRPMWGDCDNDGYLDLLLSGFSSQGPLVRIYRNQGDGTFAETPFRSELPPRSSLITGPAYWMDSDNDGDLDIWVGFADQTYLFRNEPNRTFTALTNQLPRAYLSSFDAGDIDRDGDHDLLVSGRQPNQQAFTRIIYQRGPGIFTNESISVLTSAGWRASWGDFNNDGWLDALVAGTQDSSSSFRLFLNEGATRQFTAITTNLPRASDGNSVWGDYNGDGFIDLVIAGRLGMTNLAQLFFNDGNHGATNSEVPLPGLWHGTAAGSDFDRDGDLDLLLAGGNVTCLWANGIARSNTPPSTPANLTATVLPEGWVMFAWSESVDAETTNSAGLNYNLRVGTVPGGQNILAPSANLATGFRRMPQPGNAGPANFWRLKLPPGTYYWSVQAIDPAFAGSPFAAEASFTITNITPWALQVSPFTTNAFHFRVVGEPARTYQIDISSNFVRWYRLGYVVTSQLGVGEFTDTDLGRSLPDGDGSVSKFPAPRLFYRVRPWP